MSGPLFVSGNHWIIFRMRRAFFARTLKEFANLFLKLVTII